MRKIDITTAYWPKDSMYKQYDMPLYVHGCTQCIYLGSMEYTTPPSTGLVTKVGDLYVCPGNTRDTPRKPWMWSIIVRESDESADYISFHLDMAIASKYEGYFTPNPILIAAMRTLEIMKVDEEKVKEE